MTQGSALQDAPRHRHETDLAVFIGGSAGGIEALVELLSYLPADLAAPVLVVLHVAKAGTNVLPAILDRAGDLHAVTPLDGESLMQRVVYVAPHGSHMLVERGRVRLTNGPAEHGMRPAIDPLLRSAARAYGPRALGVILSGMLDDGTAGLREIRERGGWTLVQDPDEAMFPSMPRSALADAAVDDVLPVRQLAAEIGRIVGAGRPRLAEAERLAVPRVPLTEAGGDQPHPSGTATDIACPCCGGTLWEQTSRGAVTYRCAAGHLYSPDSLLAAHAQSLDGTVWKSIALLQERAALLDRLQKRSAEHGRDRSARYFKAQAEEARWRAVEMRRAAIEPRPQAAGPRTQDHETTQPRAADALPACASSGDEQR